MITQTERSDRLRKANDIMEKQGFRAVLIVGNGSVAPRDHGYYRYFVDNRVYYHRQILVMVTGQPPTVCCGSLTHLKALNARGFQDVRMVGDRLIEGVIDILHQRGITSGKVGFCKGTMPAAWYQKLRARLPRLTLEDCEEALFPIRTEKSREEVEIAKKCAGLADAAYADLVKLLRPGMTEREAVAELDYAMKKRGAEETFTLLASGSFDPERNGLGLLHNACNSSRVLQAGDCVAAEITPRFEGYWTQLVRTVCIGEENKAAAELQQGVTTCIEHVIPMLRPGTRVGELAREISRKAEQLGFRPVLPFGHICGVDLNECRVEPDSGLVLTDGMTVILHPTLLTGALESGIYWGETYLVTPEGGSCLMNTPKVLETVPADGEVSADV